MAFVDFVSPLMIVRLKVGFFETQVEAAGLSICYKMSVTEFFHAFKRLDQ